MRKITIYLTMLFIMAGISHSFSQLNISVGATLTQNFDTLGTAAVATLPAGWSVDTVKNTVRFIDPYSQSGTLTMRTAGNSMSTSAANGIYNYAAGDPTTATDRAIGGISSGASSKSVNVYTYIHNNGSSGIGSFTISYDVEKYRHGSNPSGFSIQLYYSTDGSTWINAGTDFLTSFPADADNSGFASAPGATVNITNKTLTVNVAAGTDLYLVWNYSVTSGLTSSNAQGLGIDNVSITANGQTIVPPAKLVITDVNGGASPVRNTAFSVTVQAQDTAGTPTNVLGNTPFTLIRANGTGNPGGTYVGTIPTGSNQITLTGVTYNVAENGVTLYPHDNSSVLSWDTCTPFNVVAAPIVASKLVVLSVNGGINPMIGSPFTLLVQTQDNAGNVANVSSDVIIDLSKITGNGILSGILSGTVVSGTNQVTFTGILYDVPESGISIKAADHASILTADTSDLFTVDSPYPGIAILPTSYDWAPVSLFPTGWYESGLGSYTTGNLAPNSGKFDNTGDNLVIHYNDTAGTVRYFLKTNGVDSVYQFDVLESANGASFSPLASYTDSGDTLNTNYTGYILTPSPDSRFIKFNYTNKTLGNIAIDEVLITAYTSISNAVKLQIISVNNGTDPGKGVTFPIQVQAQDDSSNPSLVASDIHITLSKATGTGLFTGNMQGVIVAGTHTATIDGIIYNIAETGVSLLASDDSMHLSSGTSSVFAVTDPYPLIANIPTSYDWTPSTNYPDGWYNSGLSYYVTGHVAPNSGKFDTQGDNLLIHFNDSVTSCKFWLKGNSLTNPYQFDVMESVNGGIFTTMKSFSGTGDSIRVAYTQYNLVPNPASRYIKFIYTAKATGNVAIDDVSLTNGYFGVTDHAGDLFLSVRPNPGNGIFHIHTSCEGSYDVKVYNLLGEQLLTNTFNTQQSALNLSGFEKGIYLVRLNEKESGKTTTGKLIIN